MPDPTPAEYLEALVIDREAKQERIDKLETRVAELEAAMSRYSEDEMLCKVPTLEARVVELEGLLNAVLEREAVGYLSFCGMPKLKRQIEAALNRQ